MFSKYAIAQDAAKPRYVVVLLHSEFEQTVEFFIEERNALAFAAKHTASEVVVALIQEHKSL